MIILSSRLYAQANILSSAYNIQNTMSQDAIRVVCRLRPLNKIEIANKGEECVEYTAKDININVEGTKHAFAFDRVFGPSTAQVEIYKEVAIPVIKAVIGGFNGTIFAYGQTGGGKTWTMEGPNHHDHEYKGLIPRTIEGIFQGIAQSEDNIQFVVKCSYIEIYNQKLFDLLDPSKSRLQIKQDKHRGIFIQNVTEISVASPQQMLKTMDSGSQNRKVAFTGMNERSSRSHSLFIVQLNQKNLKKDSSKQSKLYFVDLAGSQKVSKTGCQGTQLQEAKNINKSLSSLGNVINALTSDKKQHIPYRDSKLTRILQQSLGGNSKTTLIINCSMCTYNDKQTLGTLRFGYRAKSIKNKPKVNQQKSTKQLLALLEIANKTIFQLKQQISGKMPMKQQSQRANEEDNYAIQQLKQQIQDMRRQQAERQRQLKDMQLRVKRLMLQVTEARQTQTRLAQNTTHVMSTLKISLSKLNKFMGRVYIDLQYWINNLIIDGSQQNVEIKNNLNRTFQNIMDFTSFYDKQVKQLFADKDKDGEEQIDIPQRDYNCQRNQNKKIKLIYSQPTLLPSHMPEELQMSCIMDKKSDTQQQNTIINSSDKVSQEESSLSEIQTLLQSLQTRQSHKLLIQQLSSTIRALKRENEELLNKNQKSLQDHKATIIKLQEKYEERIIDLQQRVEQYRHIIKEKDNQITNYIKELQKQRGHLTSQKVVAERLRKLIQGNVNLKNQNNMEERLLALASQRQKMFNEIFRMRNQLDEAQISIREKQQHIQSLKQVMKELSVKPYEEQPPVNNKEIEKKYHKQIYGTQVPNVVVSVKGGTKVQQPVKSKQSALRKKIGNLPQKKQQGNILPFIKGFFS